MNKPKSAYLVIITLLCTLIFTFFATFSSSYATDDPEIDGGNNSSTVTLSSAEILEYFLGETLCAPEREYLIAYGTEDVTYSTGVNTSYVEIEYNADLKNLRVYADEYSFVLGSNTLSFIPESASIDGEISDVTLTMTKYADGRYHAYFDSVYDTDDTAVVRVSYALHLPISRDSATRLLNLAYNDAERIKAEFSDRHGDYLEAKAEYDAYLASLSTYESDMAAYEEYIFELEAYEERCREYEEYLFELSEYLLAKERYDAYEAELAEYKQALSLYVDYANKYEIYLTELEKYNTYISRLEACEFKLSAMQILDTKMSRLNRSAKAAIEGGLVDTVLAERDTLESGLVGAPPAVIDLAGDSTVALRRIMSDYFGLKTDSARYAYYVKNYEDIKKAVTELFIALDYLYSNATIRATIIEMEKDEKYRILLAELYLCATALSDEPILSVPSDMVQGTASASSYKQFTYTEDYKTAGGYTVLQILGKGDYIVDINKARPDAVDEGWPVAVDEPVAPVAVSAPTMPIAPPRPVLPSEAEAPGDAPSEVTRPTEPTAVDNPGDEPKLSELEASLIGALDSGEISERSDIFDTDKTMRILRTVSKKYVKEERATVRFFSARGGTELYSASVDVGDSVYYDGELPQRAEDEAYTYSFDSWVTADGARVNLKSVSGSVNLYPSFHGNKKSYEISWNIDGEIIKTLVLYGDIPTCPTTPERASEGGYKYLFSGWDKPISRVSESTEYRAKFTRDYMVKHGNGGAQISLGDDGETVFDFGSVYDTDYDLGAIVSYVGGASAVRIKSGYFDIFISKTNVKKLTELDAATLSVRISKSTGESSYLIRMTDADGGEISDEIRLTLAADAGLSYTDESRDRLTLATTDSEGAARYHKYTLDGGKISFNATVGERYRLSFEYKLCAVSHSMITLRAEKEIYTVGELVMFDYSVADGALLFGLYYEDADGVRIRLSGTSFVMPEGDINLIAEAKYIEYKITFVSEGTVIGVQYLKLGETPTPPETPLKAASETHTYSFVGWSSPLVPATENATYEAVFEEVPIEIPEVSGDEDGGFSLYEKLLLIGFLGVPCAILALVFIVVKFRR